MLQKEMNCLLAEDNFNEHYFILHDHIFNKGEFVESRNGGTRELLNFKTILKNPQKRCIGGYGRNINIFFLLAEALWIFAGRRDVAFLDIFNSGMKNYSDDGNYFHAPYGWRMRNYGVDSLQKFTEENNHASQGRDQLKDAIIMLDKNPQDRRAVISIWNPELDLNVTSRDIPCNDLLMYKVRNNKLYQTIQNRSNDLNWGLTTNVFQFSFIGEIVASILNLQLGDQVHNSHSLHIYLQENLTNELQTSYQLNYNNCYLYDFCSPFKMDFNFINRNVEDRLKIVDFYVKGIITMLMKRFTFPANENLNDSLFEEDLKSFSKYLYSVYELLKIYVEYKKKTLTKEQALESVTSFSKEQSPKERLDVFVLAQNFFLKRVGVEKGKIIGNF